jgi:hypothetical protein
MNWLPKCKVIFERVLKTINPYHTRQRNAKKMAEKRLVEYFLLRGTCGCDVLPFEGEEKAKEMIEDAIG